MTLPVVFTANGPSGYNLTKSLRFRQSASAYLSRTPSSAGSLTTWTYSVWVKRGSPATNSGNYQSFLSYSPGGANEDLLSFGALNDEKIYFYVYTSGYVGQLVTTQYFRDYSSWYHLVFVWDTTQATAANRMKVYVNGSQVTAFATANYPAQNATSNINTAGLTYIGRYGNSNAYTDSYMAEANFINGQALTPSSFGSTNATTGVWQPAKYTGTYGTNGFYLKFTDTTSTATLGTDYSGNSNTWTVNNISLTAGTTYDSMTDVPTLTSATTANYCVLNPIFNVNGTNVTYSNGNLTYSNPASSGNAQLMAIRGTIAFPAGKYYWEYTVGATVNDQVGIGNNVALGGSPDGTAGARYIYNGTFQSNYTNPSSAASYTTGDVIGMAYDQPNGTLAFYKNNSLQGTITAISTTETFFPMRSPGSSGTGGAGSFNFGQQGFTYTPPTGFVALNTYNLPTSTIVKGNTVMDATLWTGNGSTQTIANAASFKPDLVWGKARSAATSNEFYDSIRGGSQSLLSNTTGAENNWSPYGVTAFNSNGFSVNDITSNGYGINESGVTYVGWQWQAGQGTNTTNTAGSITSTVSVNASAGFSVVTYTGTGSNATVGHGLGVAPSMIIAKSRSGTTDWNVYHSSLGATQAIYLNRTTAAQTSSAFWNNTAPTSSVFSLGNGTDINASGATNVAYCWSEIAGFSKFGSYTGNGSTDGTFVYLGFRPKYILMKKSSSTEDWAILDSSRSPYNITTANLYADLSGSEDSVAVADLLSNGIKFRFGGGSWNLNGATYIYMAFAENPFKNALAR